jgi:DNA-binding NarL/FixJ family response regulator
VKNLIIELASKEPTIYLEKLAAALRAQIKDSQNSKRGASGSLSKRELDILRRLSTGLPITQIAAGLHISNNTIKTHLKSVYKKLDVDSRHAAVARAQEMALL